MSSAPDLTSRVLRHERVLIGAGIALLVALSWAFLVRGGGVSRDMGMTMAAPPFAAVVLMWWLMMAAMMLPSAAPAVLLYARVRDARSRDSDIAQSWVFLAGYAAVWLLFSIAAAAVQQLLVGPSMMLADRYAQGFVLVAAGIYQLSPFKAACLTQCRSPGQFISRHWRRGWEGAVRLGVLHGAYCVGCCWVLMLLLFVGGVMNLAWVVALTLLVATEKLVKGGQWLARLSGAALIAWAAIRLLA